MLPSMISTSVWQRAVRPATLTVLMAGGLVSGKLYSQLIAPMPPVTSASAGLFFGDQSGYNGPLLMARYGEWIDRHLMWAARAQFRDDDPSGGRVEAFGAGAELFAVVQLGDAGVYGLGGLVVEVVHLTSLPSFNRPDMESGVYLRPHVGAGTSIPVGVIDLLFEMNYGFASGPRYTYWSFGARSNETAKASAGSSFHVYANQLTPFGGNYEREVDYRGYTIALDVNRRTPIGRAVRYSLGIDFVDFSYSTGMIELLVGTVGDIVRGENGTFTLSWVPQIGAAIFAEGGSALYPVSMLGLEARLAHQGIGLFGGLSGLLAAGPDGLLRGLQFRFGASVQP